MRASQTKQLRPLEWELLPGHFASCHLLSEIDPRFRKALAATSTVFGNAPAAVMVYRSPATLAGLTYKLMS